LLRAVEHLDHAGKVGHVALHRQYLASQFLDLGGDGLRTVEAKVVYDNSTCVIGGKVKGGLTAHALAAAGYQCDTPLQIEYVGTHDHRLLDFLLPSDAASGATPINSGEMIERLSPKSYPRCPKRTKSFKVCVFPYSLIYIPPMTHRRRR